MLLFLTATLQVSAQEDDDATVSRDIPLASNAASDQQIAERIQGILLQIESLEAVTVSVNEGVIQLAGEAPNAIAAERAVDIARRVEGAIAVSDGITRTLDLEGNLSPMLAGTRDKLLQWARALPLVLIAVIIFSIVAFAAHRLAGRSSLWSRLAPNPFLGQLLAQAVRLAGIILGLLLALNVLGATALMGTILGSAGVLGLAISFAVKDSMENYISSIMLSIRQPFRAQDHVVIADYEGIVMRLTSRSTVLMTLDGNHLRIPNSTVYKAVILNYTRNPQRRFGFVLGVDAEDDPADAMSVGLAAVAELDWILKEPAPHAIIESVGDSNILLNFMAWIDQRNADFGKARSLSIRAAKDALEANGFTLPEPIYRLRFDDTSATITTTDRVGIRTDASSRATATVHDAAATPGLADNDRDATEHHDVSPETHVAEHVEAENALSGEDDLLDDSRPVE
jgi:small-conductance mechanosensitive channel